MDLSLQFQEAPTWMDQKSLLYASRTFSLSDVETEEQNPTNLLRKNIESLREDGVGKISCHFRAATDCGSRGLSCRPEKRMLTVRQAANQRYEIQKQEKARMKMKMKQDKEKYGRPEPVLIAPQGKEKLAQSSRCRKRVSAGDFSASCETVGDMKCQLYREREKEAQKRALRLLEQVAHFMQHVC